MGHINARGTFLIRYHMDKDFPYMGLYSPLYPGNDFISIKDGTLCYTVSRHFEDFVFTVLNSLTRVLFTRESEQNPGGFALSIKDWEQVRWPFLTNKF